MQRRVTMGAEKGDHGCKEKGDHEYREGWP